MSAIKFVVRDRAGNLQRGSVGEDGAVQVSVDAGDAVSLNLRPDQVLSYERDGDDLRVTLTDGTVIVVDGVFNDAGEQLADVYISADGSLQRVAFYADSELGLVPNYVQAESFGKWSPDDDLFFVRGSDLAVADAQVLAPADADVGMFFAPLVGGLGAIAPAVGVGGAALAGAALVGGAVLAGGGDSGPQVDVTAGTKSDGTIVNSADHADGVTIKGTGTAGATVTVKVGEHTETATVDADGNWTVTFDKDKVAGGDYETEVTVTITDGDGKTATTTDTLVIDTVADVSFDAKTVEQNGHVSEADASDGVTLTGTVEEGSTVKVTIDGTTYDATVTGGTWSLDLPAGTIRGGDYDLDVVVTATDSHGNTSSVTDVLHIDTITSVTVETATIETDGIVNHAERQDGVTLTGTAEAGASVVVEMNGVTRTVTAGADGTWSVDFARGELPSGEVTLPVKVTSTDTLGNVATTSGEVRIDTLVNELEITTDITGGDNMINSVENDGGLSVSGTVEAGSTLVVTLHGVEASVTVNQDGTWTATWPSGALPSGEYNADLVVTATDAAGNTSSTSQTVQVDTQVGDVAIDNVLTEGDDLVNATEASDGITLTGTATPGLVVTVEFMNHSYQVVATDGTWTVNVPAADIPAGTYPAKVTASISDASGNTKTVYDNTITVDTEVRDFVINDPVTADDIVSGPESIAGFNVTGTVEAGAQSVIVKMGNQTVTATVNADGTWTAQFGSAAVTSGEYDATITATAVDAAGNTRTINDTVKVDTVVTDFTVGTVEGDNKVNAAEAADGVQLAGTVESGAQSVTVSFNNKTYSATINSDGTWTVSIPQADVQGMVGTKTATITAVDHVGNTASTSATFDIDTTVPDAPETLDVRDSGSDVKGIYTTSSGQTYDVNAVDSSGAVSQVSAQKGTSFGDDYYNFDTVVPDGSDLLVTSTEAGSGNTSTTYFAMQNGTSSTVTIDANASDGFDIRAIDIDVVDNAQLTLTAADIRGLSNTTNEVFVLGGSDDTLTISGATQGANITSGGKTYETYTLDDTTIYVEDAMNVVV